MAASTHIYKMKMECSLTVRITERRRKKIREHSKITLPLKTFLQHIFVSLEDRKAYGRRWCCEKTRYTRTQREEESECSPWYREGERILNALISQPLQAISHTHTRACSGTRRLGALLFRRMGGGCRHHAEGTRSTFRLWLTYSCFFPFFLYGGILLLRLIGVTPPSLVSLAQLQANWLPAFNRYLLSSVSVSLLFLCLPSTR